MIELLLIIFVIIISVFFGLLFFGFFAIGPVSSALPTSRPPAPCS